MISIPKFKLTRFSICFILICASLFKLNAQTASGEDLVDAYENYSEAPREVIYVHLNKSIYINGEMLGFTAYAFDKFSKQRSSLTSNLYCTISDIEGNVIKQKLIHVKDGVASNVFYIDEELLSGTFIFRAYTNWMLNFEEHNHFQQLFNVLDADTQTEIETKQVNNQLDIQVLGEGGHLIFDTFNTAGVIVKNKSGKGFSNAKAELIDDSGLVLNSFTLNQFGIAKIMFNPDVKRKYFVKVYHSDGFETIQIKNIKPIGMNLTTSNLKESLVLKFNTNQASLEVLKTKGFKLAIHNGNHIKLIPFIMDDLSMVVAIPKDELFSGVNIFTIFDENNKPVLERMAFNHLGIETGTTNYIATIQEKDSLEVSLKVANNKLDSFQNLSVSVLPSTTKSYNHEHNIISQLYLQPYIKTPIQDAGYYFKDINRKTSYELDNLLLTQGWSSYNWTTIFNFNNVYKYPFEQGISITSNINGETVEGTYITYPLSGSPSQIYAITETDKVILTKNLVPTNDDVFRIGYLNKKGEPRAPTIYPQFYPSTFAKFNTPFDFIQPEDTEISLGTIIPQTPSSWSELEKLDEILIKGKKKKTELQKLQEKKTKGRIFEISDTDKLRATPLYVYLNKIGFVANYDFQNAIFSITNPRVSWGNNVPLIYVDDALIPEGTFESLSILTLESIDYIDVEYYGFGGGIRGQAGYIKIYTGGKFYGRNDGKNNSVAEFEFPLTFNEEKQFYTPKYQFYNTSFFNEYGTIDWKPNLKVDTDGIIRFKIKNFDPKSITLFINGIVNDHELVSEIKTIDVSGSN